ncbi:hypothetical protein [Micromonospora auratinigra]|uniref:Uncharacterized protein n=1 Tax=Micromonospora auratinigra TaxID=261654 RepID=A0A1A8Z9I4_9ACTN|nr:hypothetical protein [Micromonospora auratinigra]SBT40497.1 hypothetical protein GA0070611_1283 [Micromonospora auratinigra]
MELSHPELSQPTPSARRPGWMWAGAAAGLGLALTMFLNHNGGVRTPAAAVPPPTETFVVSGAVVLGDAASFTRDDHGGCTGTGTHADVTAGAPVLIMTGGGGFAGGKLTDARALTNGSCRFGFTVAGVPARQDSYALTVADGEPRPYVEQELRSALLALRLD